MSSGIATGNKLGRYRERLSFASAQDDITSSAQNYVTLSGVEVLSTLKFLCIKLVKIKKSLPGCFIEFSLEKAVK